MIDFAAVGFSALLGAMALFAVLALALGCIAFCEVLAWFRDQRRRERMALEAMEANLRG